MKIAVPRERSQFEHRVAITPKTVTKLKLMGFEVHIEKDSGLYSGISNEAYHGVGATISDSLHNLFQGASLILTVSRPGLDLIQHANHDSFVISMLDPYRNQDELMSLANLGITFFAMELMPRISRAQTMDALSSQASLAGYRAIIDAAYEYNKAMPMMITPAGTILAAKVFVMGAGVAGLQAIATARRLGASVTATDVRPAAKEQVISLGAKFVAVEDEEFRQAETSAGYAKPMSIAYQEKQLALVAEHIKNQDIVVTTAAIPGRRAPKLVTKDMVRSMGLGSVVVDMAVAYGGNVECSEPGKIINIGGVSIIGHLNIPGRVAASASQLYAANLCAFVEAAFRISNSELNINWDDELVKSTLVIKDKQLVKNISEQR